MCLCGKGRAEGDTLHNAIPCSPEGECTMPYLVIRMPSPLKVWAESINGDPVQLFARVECKRSSQIRLTGAADFQNLFH